MIVAGDRFKGGGSTSSSLLLLLGMIWLLVNDCAAVKMMRFGASQYDQGNTVRFSMVQCYHKTRRDDTVRCDVVRCNGALVWNDKI